jgi:hypothetical protein
MLEDLVVVLLETHQVGMSEEWMVDYKVLVVVLYEAH